MTTPRRLTAVALLGLALAGLTLAPAARAGFDWDIEHTGSVNDFFVLEAFHTFVTNTGAVPDTVLVNMVKEMPPTWVASLCEEELCYPPFLLDIELILAPGQTTELIIDMTPIETAGQGRTHITLTSKVDPGATAAATFSVITPGLDVLLVDAAGGGGAALITAAVAANGRTSATWTVAEMGKAGAADLAAFPLVIWSAGGLLTGLDAADMTNLTDFVAGGGNLFVSGQNLAFAACDPLSPFQATAACDWFAGTLAATYVANTGGTVAVSGTAENPVFPSLFFAINGGDGTGENISPDVIAATGNGVSRLSYDTGGSALVLANQAGGRTAFAGFGLAGIATATERDLFMARMFAWFAGETVPAFDGPPAVLAGDVFAWPNPFNPRTTIRFEVGGTAAVPVAVTVYDVAGRAVRHLFAGDVAPGPRRLTWDGRDDGGRVLATGLYLARVQVAAERQIIKLTLTK